MLHGHGATGPLAIQFAHSLGCNPIVLLGCDCCHKGKMTNFYGKNRHHRPHTMENCLKGLKWAKSIEDREIISCSNNKIFEQQKLEDVIKSIDPQWEKTREKYCSLLTK